jgi:hypothetical protein
MGFFQRLMKGIVGIFIGFSIAFYFESMLYERLMGGGMSGIDFSILTLCVIFILISPVVYLVKTLRNKDD